MPLEPPAILVEVAYALPEQAIVRSYRLNSPATVAQALDAARSDPEFGGVDWAHCAVGVFGVAAKMDQALQAGDRVELYRALAADPKAARRARVKAARRDNLKRGR